MHAEGKIQWSVVKIRWATTPQPHTFCCIEETQKEDTKVMVLSVDTAADIDMQLRMSTRKADIHCIQLAAYIHVTTA